MSQIENLEMVGKRSKNFPAHQATFQVRKAAVKLRADRFVGARPAKGSSWHWLKQGLEPFSVSENDE